MKMNLEKWNFQLIGNSAHTTGFLASGNALLARLYLYLKVNITFTHTLNGILFGFYIVEDSSDLENLPFVNIK